MDQATTSTTEAMAVDLETPAPSFASAFAQQGTVTLFVGADEDSLVAHESYLTKNSEFFEAAMKKEWAEGQTRVIRLPEDDLETMTDYLTFSYSGILPTSNVIEEGRDLANNDWQSLAKLYVLGERILDKCVRNAVVSEILRISETTDEQGLSEFMPAAASNMIFDGTPEPSPIRRMAIDKHVFNGQEHWLELGEDHPALIIGVAQALLVKVRHRQPYEDFRGRQLKAEDYFV